MEQYDTDITQAHFVIEKIRELIPQVDKTEYAHNLISMRLRQLHRECGYTTEQVEKLIKRLKLDKLGW
jgi:hypothetical protein